MQLTKMDREHTNMVTNPSERKGNKWINSILLTAITLVLSALGVILMDWNAVQKELETIKEDIKSIEVFVLENRDRSDQNAQEISIYRARGDIYSPCIRTICAGVSAPVVPAPEIPQSP